MATIVAVACPDGTLAALAAAGHAVDSRAMRLKGAEEPDARLHAALGGGRLAPLLRAVPAPADARAALARRRPDVLVLGPSPRARDLAKAAAELGIPVLAAGATPAEVQAARATKATPPAWAPLARPLLAAAGRALAARARWAERAWIRLAELTARDDPHGRLARAVAQERRARGR